MEAADIRGFRKLLGNGKIIEIQFRSIDDYEPFLVNVIDCEKNGYCFDSDYITYINQVIDLDDDKDSSCIKFIKELFPTVKQAFIYSDCQNYLYKNSHKEDWWKSILPLEPTDINDETDVFDGDVKYILSVPSDFNVSDFDEKKINNFKILAYC